MSELSNSRDLDYEENNKGYDYINNTIGIKCKNYELCNAIIPDWWFDCKNNYLCSSCYMSYGKWGNQEGKGILEIIDDIECPICFETKRSVIQARCEHTICVDCFKRCHFDYEHKAKKPEFPYSNEVFEIMINEEDTTILYNNYPLIEQYEKDVEKWDEEYETQCETEQYLLKCPICRS